MNVGTRLNNWLNIRYTEKNQWKGQIGQEKGFCHFDTVEHGLRAGRILLEGYLDKGFNTVDKVVNRFAPSSENDTEAYITNVCEWMNDGSFVPRDRHENLLVGDLNLLIKAMVKQETSNVVTQKHIEEMWL
jgi:hypothetical protein